MFESGAPYLHLAGVLDENDITYLKNACKEKLETDKIPCFSLIDRLNSVTMKKIIAALQKNIGADIYYLNDFYIYTDSSFKTNWHMDTELFSFAKAVNAWILLSPEEIADPLGFIDGINDSEENYFHNVVFENESYVFNQYHSKQKMKRTATEIESAQIHTPVIRKGDVLAIDPSHFHKTNVSSPKHALGIKFLLKGDNGFLSNKQVHPILWPEVKTFNKLVKGTTDWGQVLDGIRSALKTDEGKRNLSSGFYPEQFEMYMERARSM